MRGVRSVLSTLSMKPQGYRTWLTFFCSKAFDSAGLYRNLISVGMKILPPKTSDGKVILIGDHITLAKAGPRMPAIARLHQESPNAGKGTFLEGHLFGCISMVISCCNRSIPVMAGIQESRTKTGGKRMVVRMVKQAGNVVEMMGKPAVVLRDAFFFSKTTRMIAAGCIGKNGRALLEGITRANQCAVAYREPENGSGKRKGRSRRWYLQHGSMKTEKTV